MTLTKKFEDVVEDDTYKTFKDYFDETNILHIDILRDMHKYSKYFSWLRFENCPDSKVNKTIITFNLLKSSDVYPLYMYLLSELYEEHRSELIKIFELLSDFLLRYRIVAPSGGGGALRSVVQKLLENLASGEVKLSYDEIIFELSNSSNPSGRYPNDEEFKKSLMDSVNTNYARVALIKIEEFEKSNIPVPLKDVTIEHLMPKTLTDWWTTNLGGKLESERIYSTYIDCIGNLAPISQSYNSKNSNKPWYDKLNHIKNIQFGITSEVATCSEWNENTIVSRNNDIANRACVAITPPLNRTREYQSKTPTGEFIAGIYPVSDIETPMDGAKIKSFIYNGKVREVSSWKEFFNIVCCIAYDTDEKLFKEISDTNIIHKSTSTRNFPDKDPIISNLTNKFVTANPIGETGYFCEEALSSNRIRVYTKQILDLYGLTDRFQIDVAER